MAKKIKWIIEFTYEPNPENYPGCETIEDMAEMDLSNGDDAVGDMIRSELDAGNIAPRYEIVNE